MSEIFKKGQVVPRRLRAAIAAHAKAQHGVKFGCDVVVTGRVFRAISEGPVFSVPRHPARRMNNGTYMKSGLVVKDVWFWPAGLQEPSK